MKASAEIANFDSSATMLRALARFLHGKDLPALGIVSPAIGWLTACASIVSRSR